MEGEEIRGGEERQMERRVEMRGEERSREGKGRESRGRGEGRDKGQHFFTAESTLSPCAENSITRNIVQKGFLGDCHMNK